MNITISELLKLKDINIIDIRPYQRYLEGHIPGSISISYYELLLNHSKYLKQEEKYYLYCESGFKSKNLVNTLKRLGYNVYNIEGGYHNYLLIK